jgi:DNA-nicking Smr family endonuclease
MRPPRGLSAAEAALWAQVAATVVPLNPPLKGRGSSVAGGGAPASTPSLAGQREHKPAARDQAPSGVPAGAPSPLRGFPPPKGRKPQTLDRHGLDASWERKLAKAAIAPDFTLDLHGYNLEAAHTRLDHGLALALAQQARLVLVIAGKPRPVDAADRGERRGAIRAKLLDWLAAGPHASRIAAVRPAQQRHGGAGAVYVVLKRAG